MWQTEDMDLERAMLSLSSKLDAQLSEYAKGTSVRTYIGHLQINDDWLFNGIAIFLYLFSLTSSSSGSCNTCLIHN